MVSAERINFLEFVWSRLDSETADALLDEYASSPNEVYNPDMSEYEDVEDEDEEMEETRYIADIDDFTREDVAELDTLIDDNRHLISEIKKVGKLYCNAIDFSKLAWSDRVIAYRYFICIENHLHGVMPIELTRDAQWINAHLKGGGKIAVVNLNKPLTLVCVENKGYTLDYVTILSQKFVPGEYPGCLFTPLVFKITHATAMAYWKLLPKGLLK